VSTFSCRPLVPTAGQRVAGGPMGASVCFQTGFSPLFPQKKKRNFEKLYLKKRKEEMSFLGRESRGNNDQRHIGSARLFV
jgi:hypothetical protein